MVQMLSGLITYILLAIYYHDQHQEKVSVKRLREISINIRNEMSIEDTQNALNLRVVHAARRAGCICFPHDFARAIEFCRAPVLANCQLPALPRKVFVPPSQLERLIPSALRVQQLK